MSDSASSTPQGSRIPSVRLVNGVEMPQLAAGICFWVDSGTVPTNPTFSGHLPEDTYRSMTVALESGIRHFDTALVYRTHRQIASVLGNKFANGDLKREDVFLTTKIFHGPMPGVHTADVCLPLDNMTPDQVTEAITAQFERCLEELGVGYVDLMLMHWPADLNSKDAGNPARRLAAWRVLESMLERGWARSIGVSNFSELHMEQLMADGAKVRPMVNQIEASVFVQYDGIIDYCDKHGIVLMAYRPLSFGSADLLKDPTIVSIAEKHAKTPPQIALRYLVQLGFVVLPRSSKPKRVRSNQDVFDFQLDDNDMKRLQALKTGSSVTGLPSPYDMS